MSDSRKVRIRRRKQPETTAKIARRPKPQAKTMEPAPPQKERLDLSGLEEGFDFSMDDLFNNLSNKRLRVGDTVKGIVCIVRPDSILFEIGAKSEAFMQISNDQDFNIGDAVEGRISRIDGQGIQVVQHILKSADMSDYELAFSDQLPIEGTVSSANKGGFEVSFGSIRGFCPKSQIALGGMRSLTPEDEHVGTTYQFLIQEIKSSELIVSRRLLLERERASMRDERMAALSIGQDLSGTINSITKFGAFVDLDGVDGLIPKSIFRDIAEDLSIGDELLVRIENIKDGKISLSAPSSNPWLKLGTEFIKGGIYSGIITKQRDFGLFVKISPNLEGLLHQSQIDNTGEEYTIGSSISVRIQDFDLEQKRIELQVAHGEATPEQSSMTLGDAFGDVFAQLMDGNLAVEKKKRRKNLRNKKK